ERVVELGHGRWVLRDVIAVVRAFELHLVHAQLVVARIHRLRRPGAVFAAALQRKPQNTRNARPKPRHPENVAVSSLSTKRYFDVTRWPAPPRADLRGDRATPDGSNRWYPKRG